MVAQPNQALHQWKNMRMELPSKIKHAYACYQNLAQVPHPWADLLPTINGNPKTSFCVTFSFSEYRPKIFAKGDACTLDSYKNRLATHQALKLTTRDRTRETTTSSNKRFLRLCRLNLPRLSSHCWISCKQSSYMNIIMRHRSCSTSMLLTTVRSPSTRRASWW